MSDAPFNPDDHTATEVTDYLATAEPAEVARVKAAEKDGKARVTVLEFTQANVDPEDLTPSADGYTRRVVS